MTSGSVPPANDPPNSSSTTPTDGPPSEQPSTTLLFDVTSLAAALEAAYKSGWNLAQQLPMLDEAPKVAFRTIVDPNTHKITVSITPA